MIYWKVEPHMRARGWTTAYQLAKAANISKPGAARVLSGHPVERIDANVLSAIATAFKVRNPLSLLEWRED